MLKISPAGYPSCSFGIHSASFRAHSSWFMNNTFWKRMRKSSKSVTLDESKFSTYILGNWNEQIDLRQTVLCVASNLCLQNHPLSEVLNGVSGLFWPLTSIRWANIAHYTFDRLERNRHEISMYLSQLWSTGAQEASKVQVLYLTCFCRRIMRDNLYAIPVVLDTNRTDGVVDDVWQLWCWCSRIPLVHAMLKWG
mgnify:CR=1 FL=1